MPWSPPTAAERTEVIAVVKIAICDDEEKSVALRPEDDPIPEGAYLQEGAYDCIPEPIYFPTLFTALEDYFELL